MKAVRGGRIAPVLARLVFHRSGKPRGWVRALLFSGGEPRPLFRRVVLKKTGAPRPRFRSCMTGGASTGPEPVDSSTALYRVEKAGTLEESRDVVVLVAFSADGALSELQHYQIRSYAAAGYKVALIVNAAALRRCGPIRADATEIIIIRENLGYDFGAWRDALALIGGLGRAHSLSFTNDSVLPLSVDALRATREKALSDPADVIFLTRNNELRLHGQSYFIMLKRAALDRNAQALLAGVRDYADKSELIQQQELHLSDRFAALGLRTGVLYHSDAAEAQGRNPTIHDWQELIGRGFPYLKVPLFAKGFLTLDDPRIVAHLPDPLRVALERHLAQRIEDAPQTEADRNQPPARCFPITGRMTPHGVLQSYNLPDGAMPAILLPLAGIDAAAPLDATILVVLHSYYVDIAETILTMMAGFAIAFRFRLTTDTEAKAVALRGVLARLNLQGEVLVCANRGRDVSPFLTACARGLEGVDYVLHLHTKRSAHDKDLAGWGEFLFENLIGSASIIRSILQIMAEQDVGIVYSAHVRAVSQRRNWGYDFPHARALMQRMGIPLHGDNILEFPTGTMFWARPAALKPLLDLNLQPEDFDEEAGQEDGTLAHAIERIILLVAEHSGYRYVKVASQREVRQIAGETIVLGVSEIATFLKRRAPRLASSSGPRTLFHDEVQEIYPVGIAASGDRRRRFNVLIPTAQPEKIYGGISTALKVASSVFQQIEDCDLRIVVTSDILDRHGLAELSDRFGRTVTQADPDADTHGVTATAPYRRRYIPLTLRSRDLFFSTAWWTADLGFRLSDEQERIHGHTSPIVYLIQDYEPGFYPWSPKYGLAEATYRRSDRTIAVINSEELAGFMSPRAQFAQAFCLPFEIDTRIAAGLKPTVKEKIILAYGRPAVARNAFSVIVEGLRVWQGRNPAENCAFRIAFVGEAFDAGLIAELENAECLGKLSLAAYADILNRSAVGVSLMISPHPSYPPLEMAAAGCVTITNSYEGKNLSSRAPTLHSIHRVTPDSIADALDRAVTRLELAAPTSPVAIRPLPLAVAAFDPAVVALHLLGKA